ncbi:MAG: hypothetical protein M0P99_07275 [Candidatus Cloacimonetes bacterium]|nr:hypothetical protein [Candidatus Cloacimonadota bacterium]
MSSGNVAPTLTVEAGLRILCRGRHLVCLILGRHMPLLELPYHCPPIALHMGIEWAMIAILKQVLTYNYAATSYKTERKNIHTA